VLEADRQVIAWCAVGLGNKICTLLGAMHWSYLLRRQFKIVWLSDPHCLCSYTDLFEDENCLINGIDYFACKSLLAACNKSFPCSETLSMIARTLPLSEIKAHYLKLFLHISKNKKISSTDLINNKDSLQKYNSILYQNSILSPELDIETAVNYLKNFKIQSHIKNKVKDFVNKHNINESVKGIALRKTDAPVECTEEYYYSYIKLHPNERFYVTSDDNQTKDHFNSFKNVVIFKTDSSVIWDNNTVCRSKEVIIDAFIEMLILSHTTPFRHDKDIKSTFFLCILLMNMVIYGFTETKIKFANTYKQQLLELYLKERG